MRAPPISTKSAAQADGVGERRLFVQHGAELVEIGEIELGAESHLTLVRLDLAQDQLEQGGLAAAVGSDQADLVAAQDAAGEILHHGLAAVMLADLAQFRHQLARTFAFVDGQRDLADARAPRAAFQAQRLQAPHPAFVAGPARFDALADPHFFLRQELVELAAMHRFAFQRRRFLLLIDAEVPRVTAQVAAVELDDAGGDIIEKAPVVGDEQHAAGERQQHLFQPFDRSDVEMVGRLVQQQQFRREHQRPRQRDALLQSAGQVRYQPLGVELQARQRGRDLVLEAPAVARIEFFLQLVQPLHQGGIGGRAGVMRCGEGVRRGVIVDEQPGALAQPFSHRFEHAQARLECGLLGYARQLQPRRAPQLAVVRDGGAVNEPQQARLAGAVAADQTNAFARLDHQIDMVEQRHVAVRQGNLGKLN